MRNSYSIAVIYSVLLLRSVTAEGAESVSSNGESHFLRNARQLTFEGRRSGEGYFSPDGQALVFQSEREAGNPFYQIYLLNLTSGDASRVSPGLGKTTCAFFRPDTDEVLFASTHLDPATVAKQKAELDFRASGQTRRYSWDYDEAMDIFIAKRDGTGLRAVTRERGYDAEAAFSPDGRQIVFCSLRQAYPLEKLSAEDQKRFETDPAYFGDIYLMNADGSNVRRLTQTPGYDGGPFFSPDGQRIIWRRFEENGVVADIFTMKTDGSDVRKLTAFQSMSWAPFFHPSGEYVIFTSNKLGFENFELHLVDAQGLREPVRITFTEGFDGLPVFSPDGTRLSWTSNRTADRQSQLYLAEWNHTAARAALMAAPLGGSVSVPSATPASAAARAEGQGTQFAPGDFVSEIAEADLRRDVSFLAAPEQAGRMTGSPGAQRAAQYAARRLEASGAQPFGTSNTFFQSFNFTAGVQIVTNENRLVVERASDTSRKEWAVEKDFRPLSFTANGTAEGDVVFAGYGLKVPGGTGAGYDSYASLNVSNKIVLVLRYVPEAVEPARRQELNRYAGLRYKAMLAREHGARAVLFVTGPNSPNAGELIGLSSDGSVADSGIVALSITAEVAEALLTGTGRTLKELQTQSDTENPHGPAGLEIPGQRVRMTASIRHIRETDRNVLGVLPPTPGGPNEYVLVGAHYDHLGHGETGAMRRAGEEHAIHPGADDNASGTSVVLELAAALAELRRTAPQASQRGVIFALWSGEEMGLIGSSHFAEHPVVPLSNIVAFVNFDMVGRLRDNKLNLQGVASSGIWRRLVERRNVAAGFQLVLQDDPYLPTDVTALYPKHIPVLNFFTGGHDDYHRPTDTAATLNYEGLERIGKFARSLVSDLMQAPERPDYVKVERSSQGGGRDALRVFLGTIPDYASDVAGVKISGVRAGSPAERAGLKGGDVIVEFGGQKIANIYDYTFALDAAKIGQKLPITVQRDGQALKVEVTPEARK